MSLKLKNLFYRYQDTFYLNERVKKSKHIHKEQMGLFNKSYKSSSCPMPLQPALV